MKNLRFIFILILCATFCLELNANDDKIFKAKKYKIFILHSYNPEMDSVQDVNKGIFAAFNGKNLKGKVIHKPISYEYKVFYMDSKRKTSSAYLKELSKKVIDDISIYNPDVIISVDDNAVEYIIPKLDKTKFSVVLCDINGSLEDYGLTKAPNVTGTLERQNYDDTIKLIKTINPNVDKIAVVLDDSPVSSQELKSLTNVIEKNKIKYDVVVTGSYEEWKKAILRFQDKNTVIMPLLYYTFKDINNNNIAPSTALKWLFSNSKVPEYGGTLYQVREGFFAAVSTWSSSQGYDAANMAIRILQGAKPSEIPVTMPKIGSVDLNLQRAKMLKVKIPFEILSFATVHKTMEILDKREK